MIEEILVDSNEGVFMESEKIKECQAKQKTEEIKSDKTEIKFGNVLFERKTKVYAKINAEGFVINVQSDVALESIDGWTLIDEGVGDKFVYAHTEYFDKPLVDEFGKYQIKLEK